MAPKAHDGLLFGAMKNVLGSAEFSARRQENRLVLSPRVMRTRTRRPAARSTQTGPEHTLPRDLTNTPPSSTARSTARYTLTVLLGAGKGHASRAHAAARRALTRAPDRAAARARPTDSRSCTPIPTSHTARRLTDTGVPASGPYICTPSTTKPTQHEVFPRGGWVGSCGRRAPDAPRACGSRRRPREDPTS